MSTDAKYILYFFIGCIIIDTCYDYRQNKSFNDRLELVEKMPERVAKNCQYYIDYADRMIAEKDHRIKQLSKAYFECEGIK